MFDESGERQRFAAQVPAALAPGGMWLSFIGSTEGPPREVGPPRRSANEVALAIEPVLEIIELRSAAFHDDAKAWFCLSRQAKCRHNRHAARLMFATRHSCYELVTTLDGNASFSWPGTE